jgi:hypothetical protein
MRPKEIKNIPSAASPGLGACTIPPAPVSYPGYFTLRMITEDTLFCWSHSNPAPRPARSPEPVERAAVAERTTARSPWLYEISGLGVLLFDALRFLHLW